MNARKHSGVNVLDPFNVIDGWFHLDFRTMSVHPSPLITPPLRQQIIGTRDRLQLNTPECILERQEKWDAYDLHNASAIFLYRQAPFIAMEAIRQNRLRPSDAHITVATVRAWLDS